MHPFMRRALAGIAALTLLSASAAAEMLHPSPSPTPEVRALEVQASTRRDDGRIRVLLRSLGRADALHLTVEGSYALEGDAGFCLLDGATVVLTAMDGAVWLESGGLLVRLGDSVTLTRHAAEARSGLRIAESEKDALYCGDLTVSEKDDALRCVLSIDVEEYLYGVVAYEMSDSFPMEALKAQAVAARTYALRKKDASVSRDYDVTDTTADQVFKGYDAQYENVLTAVDATCGVVGTVNGAWAECYYTASNGGQTALASDVWGGEDDGTSIRRDDPFDMENPRSLVNSAAFSADLSDCAALRALVCDHLDEDVRLLGVEAIEPIEPDAEDSRRFQTLRMTVAIQRQVLPAASPEPTLAAATPWSFFVFTTPEPEPVWEDAQVVVDLDVYGEIKDSLNLGLNGGDYELISVQTTDEGFVLEMRRFGHGVGMSQRGAQWMAGEYGYDYAEILGFYYPGMALERISWETEPLSALSAAQDYPRAEPTPKPTPAPLPAPEEGEFCATVALENADSTLNVREQPSTSARILDQIEDGREVLAFGEPDENGWIRIRTAEWVGYCQSDYLAARAG